MKHKRGTSLTAAVMLAVAVLPCGALTAETDTTETAPLTAEQAAPSAVTVYPIEVHAGGENGVFYLKMAIFLPAGISIPPVRRHS